MLLYISVVVLQILYTMIKYVHIRYIIKSSLIKRLIVTGIANLVWLTTNVIGIGQGIAGNYYIAIPYLLGTLIGTILEHKLRGKNYD